MPRKPKSNNTTVCSGNNEDSSSTSLERMPLAKAVLTKNPQALTELLKERALPNARNVQHVTLEQSVGEAFTGGRSTPVYYITAQVTNDSTGKVKERQFVVKLVQMLGGDETEKKDHGVSTALLHKRESYAVERRFYEYVAPELLRLSHLHIPKLLASDNTGNHPDAIACWLMTDVRVQFPLHPAVLDPLETHLLRALDWLAQFHAHYWGSNTSNNNNNNALSWRRTLWERGGFWNKQRYHGNVTTPWLSTCQWLSKNHPDRLSPTTKSLGNRFQALQTPLGEFMLQQSKASSSWSTMIHGDYKAANLFFVKASSSSSGEGKEGYTSVAAVDFQYTGAGVPAEDVAYLLFPDALVEYWDHESILLQYYHGKLLEALMCSNKGGPSSLPFDSFHALYQLSRVEMMLHWLQKGWVASTDGDAQLVAALETTMDQLDGGKLISSKDDYQRALSRFVGTG